MARFFLGWTATCRSGKVVGDLSNNPRDVRGLQTHYLEKERIMAHVISDECIACGACASTCPVDAISEGEPYVIDAGTCTDCGACVDSCPVDAISPA